MLKLNIFIMCMVGQCYINSTQTVIQCNKEDDGSPSKIVKNVVCIVRKSLRLGAVESSQCQCHFKECGMEFWVLWSVLCKIAQSKKKGKCSEVLAGPINSKGK